MTLNLSWHLANAPAFTGYYVIRGIARGHSRALSISAELSLSDGSAIAINLFITNRGRIVELVQVGAPIVSVSASHYGTSSPDLDIELIFVPLHKLGYLTRRIKRVARALRRTTVEQRVQARMGWSCLFHDLDGAYRWASRLRAGMYFSSYQRWHNEFYRLGTGAIHQISRQIGRWENPPQFTVWLDCGYAQTELTTEAAWDRTRKSLDEQIYRFFRLVSSNNESDRRGGMSDRRGVDEAVQWTLKLRPGAELAPDALYRLADAARRHPDAILLYTDDDCIDVDGKLANPNFKPDWSPELLRSSPYIGETFAWRSDKGLATPPGFFRSSGQCDHAFLLDASMGASSKEIVHVPAPVWHLPTRQDANIPTANVVSKFLGAQSVAATVHCLGEGRCRVRYQVPMPAPRVSIIIPTRDGLAFLKPCIEKLLSLTDYPNYEIIVMDNQSEQPATHSYFEVLRGMPDVRVILFDEAFNYSRINNAAAALATGSFLCLLNNDTEVISPEWLDEMVGKLMQPGVGVVGAKLLYGDESVQHAGDAVGPGGCADHLHGGIGRDDPGYMGRATVAQDLSAVTAACLLTKKAIYEELNGLNEKDLPVAFNDVDYCLRVREAGWRVVWTPHALLYHLESVSRGKDLTATQMKRARGEVSYMRKRWSHIMHHDPFYNPNLNYQRPDFSLSAMPRVDRPWLRARR